jgi:hypothetical protein
MRITELSFTPSEYILLNADKYAPEAKGKNGHNLLCSDGVVNGPYLAAMLVSASLLANQGEKALEIDLGHSKRLFRLDPMAHVYLRPQGQPPNWSGYTLENTMLFIAGQLFAMQDVNTVRNAVYELIREDCPEPWQKVIEVVEWGLASSNWLIPVEGEAAAAFSTPFICPAKVRDLVLAQPEEPVRDLLTSCKRDQPELWKNMFMEVELAFKDRRQK